MSSQQTEYRTIIPPLVTSRQFRYIELPNKIRTVLISHPQAKHAACTLSINTGAFHDPKPRLGLSHFLEHLIFLGNKRFPEEDYLRKFLKLHSGVTNASTDISVTSFYFDVDADYLADSLDIFSASFVDPLFNESSIQRELNAIQSEFNLNLNQSRKRVIQCIHYFAKPTHYFNCFLTGNMKTLHPFPHRYSDTRSYMTSLWKQYYSSEIMTLSILGKGILLILFIFYEIL